MLRSGREIVAGWKDLDVQAGFIITAKTWLNLEMVSQALPLYQPLMGVSAYGVYAFLSANVDYKPLLSKRKAHKELLVNLGVDLPTFYEARIKLEALGLLKTYMQEDSLGKLYIYEVQQPLMGQSFFTDDLMAALLLETVGQRQFEQLERKYNPKQLNHPQAVEITKNLLEVYKLTQTDNLYTPKVIGEQKVATSKVVANLEDDLDKQFLQQLLTKSFINAQVLVEHYDALKTVHLLYGLDELQIVHLLEQAANVQTGQVDLMKFKQLASQQFESRLNLKATAAKEVAPSAKVDNSGMTTEDLQLIAACRAYLPLEFLEKLKADMGTFATKNERYLVQNLVERQSLPNAVINILIHYLLSDQNKPYFGSNFESIAADWAKKQISNPEDAIRQVRSFYQRKDKQAKQTKFQPVKRRVIQKESLPAWAKPDYQEKDTPDDPAKSKQIEQLMAKINAKKKSESWGEASGKCR